MQPQRGGRARQDCPHEGDRLGGEVRPVIDIEPGGLNRSAQPRRSDDVAAVWLIGPRQRVVGRSRFARGDIPDREAAPGDQDAARLGVQARLVCHVHLDMLADYHVKRGVGQRQGGHVRLPDGDLFVEAGDCVEPVGRLAVLRGQVDGGYLAAVGGGKEPRGPPDASTRVEHAVLAGDPRQLSELPGSDSAHRVEVFERAEVRRRQMVHVFARGDEGALDALSRQASRVLGVDPVDTHGLSPFRSAGGRVA